MNLLTRIRKSALCRIPVSLLTMILIVLPPGIIPAQAPDWWSARGVLKTDGSSPDDYAALNQGQLKNLVSGAVLEMDEYLDGGAGIPLHGLLYKWAHPTVTPDDFATVNLGQLKAVAAPVYDRLIAVGMASGYPWNNGNGIPTDDYALANIGQAKNLFAFNARDFDSDYDGIPDWWERKYGLNPADPNDAQTLAANGLPYSANYKYGLNPNDPNSSDTPHTINGQTDGLTWLEAFQQGFLDKIKPPASAVEIVLRSNVQVDGIWSAGGAGTGEFTTFSAPFNGSGSQEFIDPETGDAIPNVSDVLNADELAEYNRMKALPDGPPATMFDGAEWKTAWNDSITPLFDAGGNPVFDTSTNPATQPLHGNWSCVYHIVTETKTGAEYVNTGAKTHNDCLGFQLTPADHLDEIGVGQYKGTEIYEFDDDPENPTGTGIQISSANFAAIRNDWLTISKPYKDNLHYFDPNGGKPMTATKSSDGKYEGRLGLLLKTDDGQRAVEDIKRTYLKVTTNHSDPSHPSIEFVSLVISKGEISSNLELLQPAEGTTEAFQTVEFQTSDIAKGFDYPLQGDPPMDYTAGMTPPIVKDQDNPEWWTSVARASANGLNINSHVKVVFDSLDLAKLCELHSTNEALVEVKGDGLAKNATLTNADTLLEIKGFDAPVAPGIQTVDVHVRIKATHQVLQTLKVLVMPERKVRVRVLFVEDKLNTAPPGFPPAYIGNSVPDEYRDVAAIVTRLNEVYRQNCLRFIADADSGTVNVSGWDFDRDGILDCDAPIVNEFERLTQKLNPTVGALNIFVFRGILHLDYNKQRALGFTLQGGLFKDCVIVGAINHQSAGMNFAQSKAEFLHTCAHEVGHSLRLSSRQRWIPRKDKTGEIIGYYLDPHDGGVLPSRYRMVPLMLPENVSLHPEYTWLRHEDWEHAWIAARKYFIQ